MCSVLVMTNLATSVGQSVRTELTHQPCGSAIADGIHRQRHHHQKHDPDYGLGIAGGIDGGGTNTPTDVLYFSGQANSNQASAVGGSMFTTRLGARGVDVGTWTKGSAEYRRLIYHIVWRFGLHHQCGNCG